jgi:hypothetical protein
MTALDAPSRKGDPAAPPFLGMPSAFAPLILAGMAVGTVVLWVVATQRSTSTPDPLTAHLLPWARRIAYPDERDQFLYHIGIMLTALGGFVGAWTYGRFMRSARKAARPAPPAKQSGRKGTRAARNAAPPRASAAVQVSRPPRAPARRVALLLHATVVVALGVLLYVPDYRSMAGTFLSGENFHHWHFFAIMPTYAYLSGLVPVLESYSQYGVGIPVIIGNLSRLLGDFSHAWVVWVGMTYGVFYFIALYALLWAWLHDWPWAVAGLAFAVLLQQFSGLNPPEVLWQYPSSTILRSPLDVWVFLLLTGHVYRRSWWYVIFAGLIVSVAILWESDTGIYLAGGYAAYCAYCWLDEVSTQGWSWARTCRYLATGAMVPAAFLVLMWLSVGRVILTAVFWNRFLEPLRLFRSGFGMLPMPAPSLGNLHVFLTPGLYVFASLLTMVAALRLSPHPWRGGYLLGALGVYGLGVYHQYVGRSHPWNWFHVCIPFVILAIMLTRLVLHDLQTRLQDRAPRQVGARVVVRGAQLAPLVLLGTAIVLLSAAPTVRSYPGILSGRWFIAGVDWNFPGVGFRTRHSKDLRDRLEAVAERIRQDVPAQEPVAILSEFDGILYVMTKRRPFSRFVPMYPSVALDSQADEVVNALRNQNVRHVFWERKRDAWGTYLPRLLAPQIEADFEIVDRIQNFEVWRRRAPPA